MNEELIKHQEKDFTEHQQFKIENQEFRDALLKQGDTLSRIEEILKPMSETYKTTEKLGKWIMAFVVFVSILIGILVGLKNLGIVEAIKKLLN